MSNNKLNIFEIMGEEDPGKARSGGQKEKSAARQEKHTRSTDGQGQNVPDPFFQDAINEIFSQNRESSRSYSNGDPVRTYSSPSQTYGNDSRNHSRIRDWGNRIYSRTRQMKTKSRFALRIPELLKGGAKEIILETAVVLVAVVLFYHFILSISHVSGDSMNPAFCDGDRVLILRIAKGNIQKGDVIVFETKQGEKLIKRVIAVEGDTVDISSTKGGLYVNGEAVEEDYIYTATSITDEKVTYPVTVGEDCYFVLGDNRTGSRDSRNSEIGAVNKKDVIGKVILNIRGT